MTTALSNADAIKEIRRIARDGRVRFSKNHFWKRQRKRKIDMTDVQRIIRGGYIEQGTAPEYDTKRDVYRYCVCGLCDRKNVRLIIALYQDKNVIEVITVMTT